MRSVRILPTILVTIFLSASFAQASPSGSTTQAAPTSAPTVTPAPELSAADIYKKDLPSVIYIEEQAKDGKSYIGSGFMAIKDGYAITAWHMVHDAKSVTARFSNGETYEITGLVDHDAQNDVALVKVKVSGVPLLSLNNVEPEIGAKAYVIGTPLDQQYDFTITDGIISQIRRDPYLFQFTCPATHGDSGGPVLDSAGQVIGIVRGGVDQGPNIGFAVPAKYAMALDSTLPTKPWSDVVDDTPADQQQANTDQNSDKALETSFIDTQDAIFYLSYIINSMGDKRYFKTGVPPRLYTFQDTIKKDSDALSSISTTDTDRENLKNDLIDRAEHTSDAIEYEARSILAAESNNGWSTEANDLTHRAMGLIQEVAAMTSADKKVILSLSGFASDYPVLTALMQSTSTFHLQMTVMIDDPLFVTALAKGGVCDRLGLRAGDRLVSVDGQKVTDLVNFHDLLQKDIGKTADIVIMRDDKQVEIKKQVPDN